MQKIYDKNYKMNNILKIILYIKHVNIIQYQWM